MFDELYEAIRTRYGSADANLPMGEWICANTTIKRRPFSFADYQFQRAIADDMHPDMYVEKCSQIGLTEVQIRKFLAMLTRHTGIAGIFSFPNDDMQTRQYNARIKPILDADPIFSPSTTTKPIRNRDQIQIRDSFGFITGCTEGDATSTSADFLFHDELDLSPQKMIKLYQSRIQNSSMKITQAFSTPTFLDFGINKGYSLTDQREYLCRCDACNHWQIPDFSLRYVHVPDWHFDVEKFLDLTPEQILSLPLDETYVKCESCGARLDLGDPDKREWVATYESRTNFRGYKVRPFSTDRLTPSYIFKQLAKHLSEDTPRYFCNTVLGDAFTESSAQLQRTDIDLCKGSATPPTVSKDIPSFLGIDAGLTCHITVSHDDADGKPVFSLFETCHFSQVEDRVQALMQIYNICGGCMDRYPYTPLSNDVRDLTSSTIMPVGYGGKATIQPVKDELGLIDHYQANRTQALDKVATAIRSHRVVLSGYTSLWETLVTHLRDMVRDEQPEKEPEWKKLNNNDHFFHSMALNLLARRVSDHMYSSETASLLSNVIVSSVNLPGVGSGFLTSTKGVNRISRLGAR